MLKIRGVRGAISAEANTCEAILAAVDTLMRAIIAANALEEDDIASILFSTTPDLTACYPAKAVRDMGWTNVAMLGFQEMGVPDAVPYCIRVLIHWNTETSMQTIKHIYLGRAEVLRPDWKNEPAESLDSTSQTEK
jgi:chorismate mutase